MRRALVRFALTLVVVGAVITQISGQATAPCKPANPLTQRLDPAPPKQDFKTQQDCSDYWEFQITRDQSKYKLVAQYQEDSIFIRQDEKSIMCGIESLLKHEGDKRKAGIGANLSLCTSEGNIPNPSVEIAALYEISEIFGAADKIYVIRLYDSDGNRNSRKAIKNAYRYYREWFAEVRKIGLAKAREKGLDPLKGKDVHWD